MTDAAPVLEVEGLTCIRGRGANAFRLDLPHLRLNRGDVIAVTGPSGCGKSTLLDLLGLVLRPLAAQRFRLGGEGGVDLAGFWRQGAHDRLAGVRATRIGYVLQTGGLLPFLSVRANIHLSLELLGRARDDALARGLVDSLRIGDLLDLKPRALSIGERQRVAIARALAHGPALLLADEPTASLDPHGAERVMGELLRLVGEHGMAAIVVSHDWDLVASFGLRQLRAESLAEGEDMRPATRFRA